MFEAETPLTPDHRTGLEGALLVRRLYFRVLPVLAVFWLLVIFDQSRAVVLAATISSAIWLVGFIGLRRRVHGERVAFRSRGGS